MISLPPHLEADLPDYVEGVALPADRAEAVARALAQSPELAALVGGMKGDRAALQGLGTEPAPAGLLAQVESVLEREMLLGAATLESAAPSAIPLSKVRPLRPASSQHETPDGRSRRACCSRRAEASCFGRAGGVSLRPVRPPSAGATWR